MATTQGYQQVVVVPTVVSQPQTRSDFLRRGVKVGGLALGLPCVICLSVVGVIFVLSGVSILSVDSIDLDDVDFDFDDDPLDSAGIVMLIIGIVLIVASISLCYVGQREYKKFTQGSAGRVINQAPTVAGSYQVTTYSSPGGQQVPYQPPVGGQMGPQMPYQGVQTAGQMPYPGAPAVGQVPYGTQGGQMPYGQPPAGQMPYGQPPAGQMPYGTPAGGQMPYGLPPGGQMPYGAPQGGQMPYGAPPAGQMPYPAAPGTYPGQPDMYGKQQYATTEPHQAQAPYVPEMAPGMPSKGGVPGETDLAAAYERPPPYAP